MPMDQARGSRCILNTREHLCTDMFRPDAEDVG
jgi:hypothetical protein